VAHSYSFGTFVVRPDERRLLAQGKPQAIGARAYDLLICLIERRDRVVSKYELLELIWPGLVVEDNNLTVQVSALRKLLGAETIATIPGRGYRFALDVSEQPTALRPPAQPAPEMQADRATAPHVPADPAAVGVDFRQDIRFATTTDGVRIAYATSGEGPRLVRAAHWMTHVERDWRSAILGPMVQRMSRRFSLLRYDGRGTGLSDREVRAATLDEMVIDLETVVAAAGFNRFALLGMSGGAAVAIRYAARHPDKVSCLVLAAGSARGALHRGDPAITPASVEARARVIQDGWGRQNPAYRQIYTSLLYPGADPAQIQSFNQLQLDACSAETAAQMVRKLAEFDATADLPLIRCPTLVLHSPHDQVPFAEGRLCATLIPGARFEAFDSPNHLPLPGEPAFDRFWSHIEEFFLEAAADAAERPHRRRSGRPVLRDVNQARRAR
jgi:DNA-binding winged helix-turn-helix (wHTH) protein/pimeloyl-ACP methyl ester carboxylesterase